MNTSNTITLNTHFGLGATTTVQTTHTMSGLFDKSVTPGCPSCGRCRQCGRSDQPQFVPVYVPYPVYLTPWWDQWTTARPIWMVDPNPRITF